MATLIENTEGDSVRDALDAAFEQHATDEVQESKPSQETAAPAQQATTDEGQQDAASAAAAAQRDANGRFAPKTQQAVTTGTQQQSTAGTPAPPPGGELKAPASWAPATREKWASLDPEVKAEVHRREVEQNRVLEQGAQARNFIQAFENVVRPFEVFIRSENSNPLQAVQNLMQTAAEFRVGTPARKVQLVAGLIRDFGVSIEDLDTALAGGTSGSQGQQQGAQQQQFRDPRFDAFLAQQQAQQQATQQREMQDVHRELQAFGASHEFYNDVSATMADLLAHAARRGEALDLEKAYARACQLDAGISTIITQRAANASKGSQSQAVLRAKRAAASVKGEATPDTGATVPKDDSVRAAIEAAMQTHSEA